MDFNLAYIALLGLLGGAAGYITVLLKNGKQKEIYAIVKSLVDEAEIKFGSGTGDLKYDYVVGKIYTILPGYVKIFISDKLLDFWIETAVDELQEVLKKKVETSK